MFGVIMCFDEGGHEYFDKSFFEENEAEAVALYLLGREMPKGMVNKTYVTDPEENILNVFSEEEIRQAEKQRDWETRYYTERDYGGRL